MSEPGIRHPWEAILRDVEKPGRYTGGEWNAVRKDPASVRVKVALAFPDVYEIGMSYPGQKILYDRLNRRPDVLAERVFAPWPDLEKALRTAGLPLPSIENRIPLAEFDILGFSLLYELNYSNILTILDLAGLPLRSADRRGLSPLVIAGGPAAFNPEPVAEIFDLFVIGDGEEAFPELLDRWIEAGSGGRSGDNFLRKLAEIPGVYAPGLYETHRPSGSPLLAVRPKADAPASVSKRVLSAFDRAPFPTDIVVPNVQSVFDRVAVEVARGCPQKCRFCQATNLYAPYRIKDPSLVVETVMRSAASTGYQDASLFALSVGDYPFLNETVGALMDGLERDRIALSLSSLRPKTLSAEIARAISRVRKTGFTIVPEAGSARLRRVINKDLTEEDILDAAANAFREGWRLLKLYVMIGLPTETPEDVEAILVLLEKIVAVGRGILGGPPRINLSVSSFIPKPHTPFQWAPMAGEETLRERQLAIKRGLGRHRYIEVKAHPIESSVLEAVFSRGDRRLTGVLIRAWRKGARFDGWTDSFRPDFWSEAFREEGLDPGLYLGALDRQAALPWDHIRTGVTKAFLLREFDRALRAEPTPSCLETKCGLCQGCDFWRVGPPSLSPSPAGRPPVVPALGLPADDVVRYRVVYAKEGPARFFGHQDLLNILQRTLRRTGVHPTFSEGFHPKMRLACVPPLPLGMEGRAEIFEFWASRSIDENEFLEAMNRRSPEGLRFVGMTKVGNGERPLHERIRAVEYSLPVEEAEVRAAFARVRAERRAPPSGDLDLFRLLAGEGEKVGRRVPSEFPDTGGPNRIVFRFSFDPARPPRPQDFIASALGLSQASHHLVRERFLLAD